MWLMVLAETQISFGLQPQTPWCVRPVSPPPGGGAFVPAPLGAGSFASSAEFELVSLDDLQPTQSIRAAHATPSFIALNCITTSF
jgi:hypothetical protein